MHRLVILVLLSSCSLIGTRRPDPPPYVQRPDCNDSNARPVLDTIFGGAGAVIAAGGTALIAQGTDSSGNSTVGLGAAYLVAGIPLAGLFITSAIIGYPRVSACKDAVEKWSFEHPELLPPIPEKRSGIEEQLARTYLRCPLDFLSRRDLDFGPGSPTRNLYPWARRAITGCGRVAWCGEEEDGRPRCGAPADLEFAVRQLAVETGCPAQTIEQLEFYGIAVQNTYRLNACGNQYSCIVPLVRDTKWPAAEGEAGSVFGSQLSCKAVVSPGRPALQPETQPPPPPQP